jgi:hypothetical protein
MLMSYSIAKHVKENTMANNICVTKRQLAVCINALEREVERITKAYENTEDKEYKELLADKGNIVAEVLQALSNRKISE